MDDFEVLYREYYGSIYQFLLRLTDYDEDLSEDLTQETFVQAYTSLGRFKGNCAVKTWLCQISKNCRLKFLRKSKKIV